MADAIETLRGLVEKAPKGKWYVRKCDQIWAEGPEHRHVAMTALDAECGEDDLIVAAVNALPALLAVAEAAKKLVEHTCDFDLETALANLETHNAPK